jgi:Kyanoviridae ribonuclease H
MAKISKKYMTATEVAEFLKLHIIQGDRGDGVPNIMSPDNCLLNNVRQGSVKTKDLETWVKLDPERFCTSQMLTRYRRNEEMVDLNKVPETVKQSIMEEFQKPWNNSKKHLLNYFIQHRLKNLISYIGDF